MSRCGYTDDFDCSDSAWKATCASARARSLSGKRGQAFLKELIAALDSMPVKKLVANSFARSDGEFCALGVVGNARGLKMDDLLYIDDDIDNPGCNNELTAKRFGISKSMANEIMYLNDEGLVHDEVMKTQEVCGPVRPHWPEYGRRINNYWVENENADTERWQKMRAWAESKINKVESL